MPMLHDRNERPKKKGPAAHEFLNPLSIPCHFLPYRAVSIVLIGLLVIVLCTVPAAYGEPDQPGEYEIKAAYLYNFTKFVEWPPEAMKRPNFTLCILGRNPFGNALVAIEGKPVRNRNVVIKFISNLEETKSCDMLFISSSVKDDMATIISSLAPNQGLLTVSDTKLFTKAGGMIGLINVAGKIRFEINNRAASQAHVQISSQLLKLATKVEQ